MGKLYKANQRGELQLGAVERFNVFDFAHMAKGVAGGMGYLRVLNQFNLMPGASITQEHFENIGLCTLVIQGCYTHRTQQNHVISIVRGQGFMVWNDSDLTLEITNPSPYEEMSFLQLWFHFPEGHPTLEAQRLTFDMPLKRQIQPKWTRLPLYPDGQSVPPTAPCLAVLSAEIGAVFSYQLPAKTSGWLYMISGHLHINNLPMFGGDSFALEPAEAISANGSQGATMLLIEQPPNDT